MQVKKRQLELDMEPWTGSKSRKGYKAVFCHPAYLTCMQSTSFKMPGWMKHKLDGIKIVRRNNKNFRNAYDTTLMAESEVELKRLLMKVKERIEKAGLKLNIHKMKIMTSGPITSW